MNYRDTLEFLYSQLPAYHRIGKAAYKSDLSNTLELDRYLGSPHKHFKTIHVGGTNGKGSVSHMIASVLMEAGYKTGLYTSPHLKDFRERIMIDGHMIPEKRVVDFVRDHSDFIKTLKPSFFEMSVALAFDTFADEKVDIAVIEVGLGGRLDSTNIISPLLSVITNIGHDHMDLLGDTIEKVASEKAGIIKNNIPVVIGETDDRTRKIFMDKAGEAGSEISFADKHFSCALSYSDNIEDTREFIVTDSESGALFKGRIPLAGDYQANNIQTVFQSFKIFSRDLMIMEEDLLKGIENVSENTGLMGRWQIIGRKPLVICDTGHNFEGISYVLNQLKRIRKGKVHFVLGFVSDKNIDPILDLFPDDALYYFTRASVPRALDEKLLSEKASGYGLTGQSFPGVSLALKSAKSSAAHDDIIFIGGSTFIVADAISSL